jgi:hypothetical protein
VGGGADLLKHVDFLNSYKFIHLRKKRLMNLLPVKIAIHAQVKLGPKHPRERERECYPTIPRNSKHTRSWPLLTSTSTPTPTPTPHIHTHTQPHTHTHTLTINTKHTPASTHARSTTHHAAGTPTKGFDNVEVFLRHLQAYNELSLKCRRCLSV